MIVLRVEHVQRGLALWSLVALLGCRSGTSVAPESASTPPSAVAATAASEPETAPRPSAPLLEPHDARGDDVPARLGSLAAHSVGAPLSSAEAVVVLLHGFGDRGDGLVEFARGLVGADSTLAAIALEARLPRSGGGRMWWPIDLERVRGARERGDWPELERLRPAGADEARDAVLGALRELQQRGVLRERLVLAGFSQGAMLAVDVGLGHPELLRGVVAFSGAVLDRDHWEQSAPAGVRFVVAHGQRDTVLPFAQGEALHSLLRRHDPHARWVPFDGPHTISPEGRTALLELLRER
ncbi:MAG: hypothetical protein R3B40_17360 [Polyangiales bacterium]|nr:hypothetical protein [Myxococcales bacterium]MCB9661264.1 hypothetical protein [Sandaracinaceae bacterium]